MKIDVLPRSVFEKMRGTWNERGTLEHYRVISIQNSNRFDTEPPFLKDYWSHSNLLCLQLDDIDNEPLRPKGRGIEPTKNKK